jgi:hypothetical protein
MSEQLDILKRWVGQFWMCRFSITDPAVALLTTMKWSGLKLLVLHMMQAQGELTLELRHWSLGHPSKLVHFHQ